MTAEAILGVSHSKVLVDVPRGACDCHVHVFGPHDLFPMWEGRSYTPPPAPLEALIAHQRAMKFDRVVVIQPSIYGTDNRCMLNSIERVGMGARGIAVIDAVTTRAQLDELAENRVVGLRLNLAAGGVADLDKIRSEVDWAFETAEPLGWQVHIFTELQIAAQLEHHFRQSPVPVVIDHFGRASAGQGISQPGLDVLLDLVAAGSVYVKLSAPYLVSSESSRDGVNALVRAFLSANPSQLLWGSNWPHPGGGTGGTTSGTSPFRGIDDGDAVNDFAASLNDPRLLRRVLVENPARLFGFADDDGL